jgi:ubiquinone biosynthesis protein UbiJ
MATKRIPRPRDPLALAKLIGDIATGQVVDGVEDGKDAMAIRRGRAGGRSRAASLTAEQRAETAKRAAKIRWEETADD